MRMNPEPRRDKALSQEGFKSTIGAAGMKYDESLVDVEALSGPITNPAVLELPPPTVKGIEGLADAMRTWLAYPTITDSFANHSDRRAWRNATSADLGQEFDYLYQENRMKGAGIFALKTRLELLVLSLEHISSEKIGELREIAAAAPDVTDYDEKSTEEKLLIVDTMESLSIRLLKFITATEAV